MASNGYLRTVRVGGFDKQDVLAYVDVTVYTMQAMLRQFCLRLKCFWVTVSNSCLQQILG